MTDDGRGQARVLVVDDDQLVRRLVARVMREEGYDVVEAVDVLSAMDRLAESAVELVLLDITLPGLSGLELLTHIRKSSDVPIILLTGLGDEGDRIRGLKVGADDYIVKPFSVGELAARVESMLRRSRTSAPSAPTPSAVHYGALCIDTATREVAVDGKPIVLTAREFDLLAFLAASPRQVFSREQLLQHVWRSTTEWQDSATVTEHVRRIRRKIEADPEQPRWVLTARGVGYRFEP
ncbi:MAG: response regulator transcription factor [Actinomycetota bacterium]|nr:response regulator transcription factor [Actinomycetota bacterium]